MGPKRKASPAYHVSPKLQPTLRELSARLATPEARVIEHGLCLLILTLEIPFEGPAILDAYTEVLQDRDNTQHRKALVPHAPPTQKGETPT